MRRGLCTWSIDFLYRQSQSNSSVLLLKERSAEVLVITEKSSLHLSELAPRVVQSEIRAMTQECDRMGGVNLAQGVCDTEVPAVVAEGAIRAIRDGLNIYT
jgi:hypothetical protein